MGVGIKKQYSMSILNLAQHNNHILITPSFGEKPIKARIKNILKYKKPAFWGVLLSLIIILIVGCAIMTSAPENKSIEEQAVLYGEEICQNYMETVDANILKYNGEAHKEAIFGNIYTGVEVWKITYNMEVDTKEEVPLTDGWYQEGNIVYGEDKYILFESSSGKLLCELWSVPLTGTVSNLEINVIEALENEGYISGPIFDGEHVLSEFTISTGERCHMLISQPAKQGKTGIWCVERWMDGSGNIYCEAPNVDKSIEEYYEEQQQMCDEGHKVGLLDYKDVAYTFINDMGQEIKDVKFIENASYEDFLDCPESVYFGNVTDVDTDKNARIYFYKASYLTDSNNEKELKNMGIDPNTLPNGFYIDEYDKWGSNYNVDENMEYSIITYNENGEMSIEKETSIEKLKNYIENGFPIGSSYFWITIKNGKIIHMEQQYIP